ncbi:hypothetical protein L202_07155 [Cryptococcus amylolentus CBS 6039]|uniref:Uncharacterized protein n=1 Tax=Cryptococcus amylolentus CBS 6039 TaxID=1295533 RepID=A0A1E3HES7_9TREE|nr:hypothetical protein L202_07155 [Cryptococcus amylolentus CBS 6039]ODN74850.1 hypothetical protein L202_07155 [Cryptococcus amylolentus CBS 6039]
MSLDNPQPTYVQSTAATDRSTISTHATRISNTFMTTLGDIMGDTRYREDDRTIIGQSRDTIKRNLDHAVTATLEAEISRMEAQGKTVGSMNEVEFEPLTIIPISVGDVLMVGSLRGEGWSGNNAYFNVPLEPSG